MKLRKNAVASFCIFCSKSFSAGIYLFKSQQWKHRHNVWDLLKANDKDTRATSIMHCPGISIVDSEQVNTG